MRESTGIDVLPLVSDYRIQFPSQKKSMIAVRTGTLIKIVPPRAVMLILLIR